MSGNPPLRSQTDEKIQASAGVTSLLVRIVTPSKDWLLQAISVSFKLSDYAPVLFEWGRSGEAFRGIEGVSVPTRLVGESSVYRWTGKQRIRGGDNVAIRVTTNVDADTVKAGIEYEEIDH